MPNRFLRWLFEDNYPLTKLIIILNVVLLVIDTFVPIDQWLVFTAPDSVLQPWRFLTYPLVCFDPIQLLFYCLWVYFAAGSLERSWGTKTFAIFFAAISAITAGGISLGSVLTHTPVPVSGYIAIAGVFVAWAMLNPEQLICLMGFISIRAKWLAAIDVGIVFLTYSRAHPAMGLFALSGCAAAMLWIRNRGWKDSFSYAYRAPQPKPKRAPHDDDFKLKDLNPFERIARARRKKKFQRLFEDDDK